MVGFELLDTTPHTEMESLVIMDPRMVTITDIVKRNLSPHRSCAYPVTTLVEKDL